VSLSRKNQHLFWSLAQSKRCAAAVPEDTIGKSLEKHRKAMALEATAPSEGFVSAMEKRVDSILEHLEFENVGKMHEFSTSACWENGSSGGGAKSYLMHEFVKTGETSSDELMTMGYHPRAGVSERRGYCLSDADLARADLEGFDICRAKVHPICEPLKVRNITKGNALPYALSKGLQLDVHGFLRKIPQFALIGEPLKDHIKWLVDREVDGTFASGDFSAATDNVKIQLTKCCFERIIKRLYHFSDLSTKDMEVFRKVLYEHEIHYPTGYGEQLEPVIQKNGQLMGSVLSFFILCLINLCTYWEAVCPEIEDFRDLNVLVNGDDILFRCSKQKYEKWLAMLPESGLTPSPGKNFFHPKYCTVNSELFHVEGPVVTRIPFYNVGMLLGQSKVARLSDVQDKPIQYLLPEILEGSTNKINTLKRYLYYNSDALKKCAVMDDGRVLNYFIPRELGGLGLQCPGVTLVSERQMKKMTPKEKSTHEYIVMIDNTQSRVAKHAFDFWTTPHVRKLFRPAGEAMDEEAENNFKDVKNPFYRIRVHNNCPRPPGCSEITPPVRPPNWCVSAYGKAEEEALTYRQHKLKLWRRAHDHWKENQLDQLATIGLVEYRYTCSPDAYNAVRIHNGYDSQAYNTERRSKFASLGSEIRAYGKCVDEFVSNMREYVTCN